MTKIEELKRFIKKEPLYLWLTIFIVLINLMTLISDLSREAAQEGPSKTKELFEMRAKIEMGMMKDERVYITAAMIVMVIAILIFAGLILDFIIFIRKKDKKVLLENALPLPQARWGIWEGLKVIILFLFFGYVIAIIEALISPLFPFIKAEKTIVSIINTTIMDLIGTVLVFYFTLVTYRHKIKDLGLTAKNLFKNIYYGVIGYISAMPVLAVALFITIFFVNLFRYEPPPQPVLEMFLGEEKAPILVYLAIFVALVGPVMEEIFFRGFLYNAIKKETSVGWSLFLSAALFSTLHAHLAGFLPILILGVFLAYLYEKTGSLVPSITLHIMHNMAMLYFVFLIKGIKFSG